MKPFLVAMVLGAAVVAAVVVLAGCSAGVGEQVGVEAAMPVERPAAATPRQGSDEDEPSTQDNEPQAPRGDPLTLTMTADSACEVIRPRGTYLKHRIQQEDGTYAWVTSTVWGGVEETPVQWTVSGGMPPYTLEIDGETRDPESEYTGYRGASGIASVSCAQRFGETFIDHDQRWYRTEPDVDSGLKTIRATVTDANGATAEASVDVYVILALGDGGDRLEGGKTYRMWHGFLFTVPEGLTLEIGGGEVNGNESIDLVVVDSPYRAIISFEVVTGREVGRDLAHLPLKDVIARLRARQAEAGAFNRERLSGLTELNDQLDRLAASVNQPPSVEASD